MAGAWHHLGATSLSIQPEGAGVVLHRGARRQPDNGVGASVDVADHTFFFFSTDAFVAAVGLA